MMVNNNRIKLAAGLALMITLVAPESKAFPLLCSDPSRLASSYRVMSQEVAIIKQEIESNLNIIKEIQNGGFAAAGAAIFGKIQNGDYDRFGKSVNALERQSKELTMSQEELDKARAEEQKKREAEMERMKQENIEKQQQAERMQALRSAEERAKEEAKSQRGDNIFSSAYNWLKNNQSFTQGVQDTLNGVANGDVGDILSGSFGAAGGATGNSYLDSLGDIASGAADSLGNGGSFKDVLDDLTHNGDIQNGVNGLKDEYEGQKERDEAAAKQAEEDLKNSLEQAKNDLQQQLCQMCKDNAIKAGKSELDAAMQCLAECSN